MSTWYFAWLQTSYWQENIKFYERELIINPSSLRPLVMLGRDHQRLGNTEKAYYYFDQLLQRNPYGYYGNLYSGFLHMQEKNYDRAIEQLTIATQQGKRGKHHFVVKAYEGLAWSYWQMGKSNLARRLANRGLKVFPENTYLMTFVGDKNMSKFQPEKLKDKNFE